MMSRETLRGFWALIATQFQGAFSDMTYKTLLMLSAVGSAVSAEQKNDRVFTVNLLFTLPFLLFSPHGGFLADRFDKRLVTVGTKCIEIVVMLLATLAAWKGNLTLGFLALFLLGAQAALFGPTKYSILPELLPERRLSWGNGILELTTFVSIILGTMMGGFLVEALQERLYVAGFGLIGLACLGVGSSLQIEKLPPANPAALFPWNTLRAVWRAILIAREDHILWLAVVGSVYFWFLGLILQTNIVFFVKSALGLPEAKAGYLMATLAVGIGLGSYVAGNLSGKRIEYGLIPLGSIGMSVFLSALAIPGWSVLSASLLLSILGFSAGFFIVPLNALLQHRPKPAVKGSVVAMANLMTFVGMLLATGVYWALSTWVHLSPLQWFAVSSLLTVVATVYVTVLLPDSLIRLVLWLLTHSVYRIRVLGEENIPSRQGALFVSNHMSFVDALLLIASTDRRMRFSMEEELYELPFVKFFARAMRVIPISSKQGPRALVHALREASRSIQQGRIVCIFAEGQITRTGQLLPFRKGFERIMKNVDAPIIPVNLDRVWGSIFSYQKGRFLWKMPQLSFQPITVSFGKPLPGSSTAHEVRQAVQELASDAYSYRKPDQLHLQESLVASVRRHPWRFAVADGMNPKISYLGVLMRSIFLARLLKQRWKEQKMVGLLLPPSVAGVTANIAAALAGRIPVNLNYTVSQGVLDSCVAQCGIQTIITSRQFLEKLKITAPESAVFLEDFVSLRTPRRIVAAFFTALFVPVGRLQMSLGNRTDRRNMDALATVIFSSGSTGDPKGVMLSQHNITSNLEGMAQVFVSTSSDCVLGILPFFHSFGFTGTLWMPLLNGMSAIYHPNPLDARVIGGLTVRYKASILLATPTFLQGYVRRCNPEDFGSLRFVMVGAEKLSDRLRVAFEEKFGIRPMEGYGCTECSPIVSVNVRDFRAPGFYQVGQKRGRIGHPLPGISVRIVDPDTRKALPVDTPGLLLVRGPNLMQGYLNRPEKTAEVLTDGWYVTGDIASLDHDGFLTIRDRLSRFSKIGGEMVPHLKVEEALQALADVTELSFAVTGIPDERKGERLLVLHTLPEDKLKQVQSGLSATGLPNLWIPRTNAFFRVDKIPILGTGKLDLRAVREMALALASTEVTS